MSERPRRKSLSIFRPTLSSLTPIHDPAACENTSPTTLKKTKRKQLRQSSLFSASSSPISSTDAPELSDKPLSPTIKPRTLQKSSRSSSILGSFRSVHSTQSLPNDDQKLSRTASSTSSSPDDGWSGFDASGMAVLCHGEVQVGGSVFRKKSQYLLLTNTHLMRFKNQAKASESFPSIPPSHGASDPNRHSRIGSSGSAGEAQASTESLATIPLTHIVAVYKLDDGRPYFTIEVAHLDELESQASTMTIQLNEPTESKLWLVSIRAAVLRSRLRDSSRQFTRKAIEYVAKVLEHENDYDPNRFRMFKVVQRASKTGGRSSSDDLGKLMSSVFYLAIGYYKVHLVPLLKATNQCSSTSISDMSGTSCGIATLSSIHVQSADDTFQLAFRTPLQPACSMHLASSSVEDITLSLRQSAEFLRPLWIEQPFAWSVPPDLDDTVLPVVSADLEDHLCFDRTLTGYCVSYKVDPSNIRYTVNYLCEDGPEFALLPPTNPRLSRYNALELLAVLRALRYNESFHSISFRNTKLDALYRMRDRFGSEHVSWSTRSGQPINLWGNNQSPLLGQELQALVLKNNRLRRLNFSGCLTRKKSDVDYTQDTGIEICEAIFPLCERQLTNVDWITLDGLVLCDQDINYLYTASLQKASHFRAIDLGHSGLPDDGLKILLQALVNQADTMESFNISGCTVHLSSDLLAQCLSSFKHLRRLDLSQLQTSAGLTPILPLETLVGWRLEVLTLSGTVLTKESIDSLSAYFGTRQSRSLRELYLERCRIDGEGVALILRCLASGQTGVREMHLHLSGNRLEGGHGNMTKALAELATPISITMRSLEYTREENFRALISAFARNKSTKYLDISRASLPFEASRETCRAVQNMFETNSTLEELDLSGEQGHLEAVTLGRGLPIALRGLENNNTLKVLRVERQALGLPGASAIASVLDKNSSLLELHCEDNEISLHAFTALVNAVRTNTSLLYLSAMERDRSWSRGKVDREVNNLLGAGAASGSSPSSARSSLRRTFTASSRSLSHKTGDRQQSYSGYTEQDVYAAVASLDQQWESETARLQGYLERNYCLANSPPIHESLPTITESSRPTTAGSLATALKNARLDRTPTAECNLQLGHGDAQVAVGDIGKALSTNEDEDEADDLMMGNSTRHR